MEINTDDYPNLLEVERRFRSLFVTKEHQAVLDRASGVTTNVTNVNRK